MEHSMSIMDSDGHLTSTEFENPRFYLLRNTRITVNADNVWRLTLERIGAQEVSQEEYEAADALRKDEAA
jgi:hypothetical protein